MKKRKKAQDVFNETNFLFSKKTDFDNAFPEIEEIFVDVTETGDDVYYPPHSTRYSKNFISEYINCSNKVCYNGGFGIASIIREMLYEKKINLEGDARCQGREGSPKGRKTYCSCDNQFHYKIQIKYKQQNEKSSNKGNDEEVTKQ